MRRWLLLLAAVLAGCGEEVDRVREAGTPVSVADSDFALDLPDGWHLSPESQTPELTQPVEILSAGTMPLGPPGEGSCAHVPVSALERMGPRDAFVTLLERHGSPHFPPRPEPFTLPPRSEGTDAEVCAGQGSRLDIHWFGFRDAGRGFHVLVAFGSEAPAARRAEAVELLDSLRFEPAPEGVHLDSDLTGRFEDEEIGLVWQMPVPPWRRIDRPLTSVHGERLVLGTFDVPPGPPDPDCVPRAAIDAMPPDGAFIYLHEYLDFTDHPKTRIPERTGELTLGPERVYECMGMSRMVAWHENGRAFQAHVFAGPEASDALMRDARSVLNSIQVK